MKLFIYNLIILFVAGFFLGGCKKANNSDIKVYEEILTLYPIELTNHLPKINNKDTFNLQIISPLATKANNCNGIYLTKKVSEKEISKIEFETKDNAKSIMTFNDSCHYVINYNDKKLVNIPFERVMCKDTIKKTIYPIPNFNYYIEAGFSTDFYNLSKIYVLDAKYGEYLDQKYLTENGVGLPNNWKHGYSKGIVICSKEKIVTYWIEVW